MRKQHVYPMSRGRIVELDLDDELVEMKKKFEKTLVPDLSNKKRRASDKNQTNACSGFVRNLRNQIYYFY